MVDHRLGSISLILITFGALPGSDLQLQNHIDQLVKNSVPSPIPPCVYPFIGERDARLRTWNACENLTFVTHGSSQFIDLADFIGAPGQNTGTYDGVAGTSDGTTTQMPSTGSSTGSSTYTAPQTSGSNSPAIGTDQPTIDPITPWPGVTITVPTE
jgi:hypothetical protein